MSYKSLLGLICLLVSIILLITVLMIDRWVTDYNSKSYSYRIGLLKYHLNYYGTDIEYYFPSNADNRWQSYLGDIHRYHSTGILLLIVIIISIIFNTISLILYIILNLYSKYNRKQIYCQLNDDNKSYSTSIDSNILHSNKGTNNHINVKQSTVQSILSNPRLSKLYVCTPTCLTGILISLSVIVYELIRPQWKGSVQYDICYALYITSGISAQCSSFLMWWQSTRNNQRHTV